MKWNGRIWIWAGLPYVATVLGVYIFDQALVAVGFYHIGILFFLVGRPRGMVRVWSGFRWRWVLGFGLLCGVTAPLIYFLWPIMVRPEVDLRELISRWHLMGPAAVIFALYSITVHPVLEETFWRGRLPDHPLSDLYFAGFHLLVLAPLVHAAWLPLVFVVLAIAAWIWRWMTRKWGGLAVPILTHALADLGVVMAVWALVK